MCVKTMEFCIKGERIAPNWRNQRNPLSIIKERGNQKGENNNLKVKIDVGMIGKRERLNLYSKKTEKIESRARERDTAKQEKGQGNRQVLGDISNMDEFRINEAKQISRPITRNFHAKLLANAQVTNNDIAPALDNKTGVHKKNKKCEEDWTHKPNPEPLDVAGSEAEEKVDYVCKRKSRERSSKKVKILTLKSKANRGILRNPKNQPIDIVADDANNEPGNQSIGIVAADDANNNNDFTAVEYLDELYKFYKITEVKSQVSDYMKSQHEINQKMRSITLDWLVDVHMEFKLMPETLFLTINIIDRYLSLTNVPKTDLQLVGICSMLIACKYEEILPPKINDFINISADAYTKYQILSMERDILEKLQWHLTVPTTYVFLVRLIRANVVQDKEMENLAFYLAELGIVHYKVIILYSPSMIAAGAVYSARCTLKRSPLWSETLQKIAGYCTEQIIDCVKLLVSLHASAADGKLQAVYWKFLSQERGSVALLSPPKDIVKTL